MQTQANVMVELTFHSSASYADPFNEVTLDLVVRDPRGQELTVPAYWDGTNVWKARYASPMTGTHRFRTLCSNAKDAGLQGVTGRIEIKPYRGTNSLYLHGPLHVSANKRHMQCEDGTPFFWLGDTWWMGLCSRLSWPGDFQKLAADRKAKGFNVIQIVAGLYPDMFPFDPRGANEGGHPWTTNYSSIRPEYFDAADRRIEYLVEQGFTPCIVGAWGYFIPWMGVERAKEHWRNLVARYGALPVVWCVAGEANLPWYLAKGFPYDDRKQVRDWSDVARYLKEVDPFHRLITIHPTGIGRLSSRAVMEDLSLLDFDMLQTPHGQRDAVAPTINTVRQSYADNPVMPVIDGEASYEMLGDSLPTEWTRRMFWICLMNGAAGHTYGANGIWQVNRKGQPHGPSPHHNGGVGYGRIPWDEAMNLPGSSQVGYGKKLFEEYDWQQFRPHPEWASFEKQSRLDLKSEKWIWFPEGNPARNAPAERRYFRRAFYVAEGKPVKSARLRISADDQYSAWLNGKLVGSSTAGADTWKNAKQFNNFADLIQPGTNVLAVVAENLPAAGANPAGLIARLELRIEGGEVVDFGTSGDWLSSKTEANGWDRKDFDDSSWRPAMVDGSYGDGPWGDIDSADVTGVYGPQASGIAGGVRIVYVPEMEAVKVHSLGRNAHYSATYFDPVEGKKTRLGELAADDDGELAIPPPQGVNHDWVVILDAGAKNPARNKPKASLPADAHSTVLSNNDCEWKFDWDDGRLFASEFYNRLSGHRFRMSRDRELALVFSSNPGQVAQPFTRVSDFRVKSVSQPDARQAIFELRSPTMELSARLHLELEGSTRRKWVEVRNDTGKPQLLLDVEMDDFTSDGLATGGGEGEPVFLEGEAFAAIEHPAGLSQGRDNRVQLFCYPGAKLEPGATFQSHVALVSLSESGNAEENFVDYIQSKSLRPKRDISVYTPFGINNLWGGCPTLDDEETMDVLGILDKWRKKGIHFDYFTLDTGWVDPASDLTRFRPSCFPTGPGKIIDRVNGLGMKFGLWFATSWGAQSAWDHPGAFPGGKSPGLPWREGYPITREGVTFCIGSESYHQLLKNAVLYHVRTNHVRLLKFDGGDYVCNDPGHGHLTGKYSVEPRFENLIDIAKAARAEAPDVFIMWYWGLRSPFWALYGDMIFESGLQMEGSGTSSTPTLYYRDSVDLALDQNARHARRIPPIVKDSLGVWLADDRWGNFMGKQRWREAMVMDLGRGNLLAPNLWGDIYLFNDDDIAFLRKIMNLAKKYQEPLLHRHKVMGDPMRNEVYGYAYCKDNRGLVFLNNDHFTSRKAVLRLNESIGVFSKSAEPLNLVARFPEDSRVLKEDGTRYRAGDTVEINLRPFEFLMIEIAPGSSSVSALPARNVTPERAADLGIQLPLQSGTLDPQMGMRFADETVFKQKGFKLRNLAFETTLPSLDGDQPILAVTVRLRTGVADWKYAPAVVQIVQARARIGDQNVQLHPVPDGRQYGNTQAEGCSWVTYKVRLNPAWSHRPMKISVQAWLPDGVEPFVESWVVKRWWKEEPRPTGDGYFTDEPS